VPFLIADGHEVTNFDLHLFGTGHPADNPRLRMVKGDVRDIRAMQDAVAGQDAVIWLAGLTNNDMCVKAPTTDDRVNRDAVVIALREFRTQKYARREGPRRFIYASSVAAYGSKDREAVEEDILLPTTPYGLSKLYAEGWVLQYNAPDFITVRVRSASVCGYSVNPRFDITVNKMVHSAHTEGVIKVNGGQQKRCHIHILDLVQAYLLLLEAPQAKIAGQAFNIVAENQTVLETANIVAEETGAKIEIGPATDDRSYTVSGAKAREALCFAPKRTVRQATAFLKAWLDGPTIPMEYLKSPAAMRMIDGLN